MKKIIIIGAGPAGLTAAYELLKTGNFKVAIYDLNNTVGGLSRTIKYKENKIDIGGHRFLYKNESTLNWWLQFISMQGEKSLDDMILEREIVFEGDKNPSIDDNVFLKRGRYSRIHFLEKFYDYPLKLNYNLIKNMGIVNSFNVGKSFLKTSMSKIKKSETTLEDFFINKYGEVFYKMFFESYIEKIWGKSPRKISSDHGSKRIRGISLKKEFKRNILKKDDEIKKVKEYFYYPKFGPGQLWENVASEIKKMGGKIYLNTNVKELYNENNIIKSIIIENNSNKKKFLNTKEGDYFISTIPVGKLTSKIRNVNLPLMVNSIASNLPYRNLIYVCLLIKKFAIKNTTEEKSINDILPDNWILIHNNNIKLGKLVIYNNWSPYLTKNFKDSVWIGLEYYSSGQDELWNYSNEEMINFAVNELLKLNFIDKKDILDSYRINIDDALPGNFGSYLDLPILKESLSKIENLFSIGRNGSHDYNNMEQSMDEAFNLVKRMNS